jgi:hypothetical protein
MMLPEWRDVRLHYVDHTGLNLQAKVDQLEACATEVV